MLVIDNGLHAGPQRSGARELKERFQLLERVTRNAHSQGLPKNGVEIDKYFSPEEVVDFKFPCRILSHQSLDGALLVRAEVVHVEIGVLRKATMNEIDKVFESATLSGTIVRPEGFISGRITSSRDYTKEKRESPRRFEKRMSFEVEDHVAFGTSRERRESAPVCNRKLAPANYIATLSLQLQRGLVV